MDRVVANLFASRITATLSSHLAHAVFDSRISLADCYIRFAPCVCAFISIAISDYKGLHDSEVRVANSQPNAISQAR